MKITPCTTLQYQKTANVQYLDTTIKGLEEARKGANDFDNKVLLGKVQKLSQLRSLEPTPKVYASSIIGATLGRLQKTIDELEASRQQFIAKLQIDRYNFSHEIQWHLDNQLMNNVIQDECATLVAQIESLPYPTVEKMYMVFGQTRERLLRRMTQGIRDSGSTGIVANMVEHFETVAYKNLFEAVDGRGFGSLATAMVGSHGRYEEKFFNEMLERGEIIRDDVEIEDDTIEANYATSEDLPSNDLVAKVGEILGEVVTNLAGTFWKSNRSGNIFEVESYKNSNTVILERKEKVNDNYFGFYFPRETKESSIENLYKNNVQVFENRQ